MYICAILCAYTWTCMCIYMLVSAYRVYSWMCSSVLEMIYATLNRPYVFSSLCCFQLSYMGSLKSAMLKSSITRHQEIVTNPGLFFFPFSFKLHWLRLLEHSQFGILGVAYFRIKNYFSSSVLCKLLCSPYYLLPAWEKQSSQTLLIET